MAATPTVVIVPGSFAPAELYTPFAEVLGKHGLDVRVVKTPSVGRRDGAPAASMTDDATEIQRVVESVLDEGKDVVIMPHSYGGVPTTESMKALSSKNRKGRAVERIIYLTAVVLPLGMSNTDMSAGGLPEWLKFDGDYMVLDPNFSGPLTFSDLPEADAIEAAKKMSDHSVASFQEKLSYPGYNDVDVHYILCEKDKIIAPEHQQAMIGMIEQSSGKAPTVHKMNSDHCPVVTHAEELATLLKSILTGAA